MIVYRSKISVVRSIDIFRMLSLIISSSILSTVYGFIPVSSPTTTCDAFSLSCSENTPNVDTCCVNSPGGHFLLTQFWDTSPSIGANDSWTIHGLWPDHCRGGFDQFCDHSRELSPAEIIAIVSKASRDGYLSEKDEDEHGPLNPYKGLLEFMQENWLAWDGHDAKLWSHEWNKHGTCISTIEPKCYSSRNESDESSPSASGSPVHQDLLDYFTHAAHLYSTLDTFTALTSANIFPSKSATYTLVQLQEAIQASTHGFPVTFKCHGQHHDELNEIWYHFNVRGSLKDAGDTWANLPGSSFVATAPEASQHDACPKEGIRWLPKLNKEHEPEPSPTPPRTTKTTTTTDTPGPTGPSTPFQGRGRLMVKIISEDTSTTSDTFHGCLIRSGEWYNAKSTSSCAIFLAGDDVNGHIHPHVHTHHDAQQALVDDDAHYHLFTLESSRAPCSFVSPARKTQPGTKGYLSCERTLAYQSIFNAHKPGEKDDERDGEKRSEVLAWSDRHQTTFWTSKVPKNFDKVKIWNWEGDAKGGHVSEEDMVRVEVHWVAL